MALTHHRVDPLSRLRQRFPTWKIFRTDTGRLWAWAKLTTAQRQAGCRGALDADTVEALEGQLREQSERRRAVGG